MFFCDALESQFQLLEQGVSTSISADVSHQVIMVESSWAIGVALSEYKISQVYVVRKAGHVEFTFISTCYTCFHQEFAQYLSLFLLEFVQGVIGCEEVVLVHVGVGGQ